jgi:hypothetical protein
VKRDKTAMGTRMRMTNSGNVLAIGGGRYAVETPLQLLQQIPLIQTPQCRRAIVYGSCGPLLWSSPLVGTSISAVTRC